jgi:hypothetical protein
MDGRPPVLLNCAMGTLQCDGKRRRQVAWRLIGGLVGPQVGWMFCERGSIPYLGGHCLWHTSALKLAGTYAPTQLSIVGRNGWV